METLQLSQVLADLSNLGAAEPQAAAAIVNANTPAARTETVPAETTTATTSVPPSPRRDRPSVLKRTWSSDAGPVDKFGRRIMVTSPPRSGSSTPGGAGGNLARFDEDLERASTLMALYDIRSKLKQQDNSSLLKAREKINALAAKQQAQKAAERSAKAAEEMRRNRYSQPKPGL